MYNPVQIRSFVTAVTEGSLSAAARKLGLTQPAVSQHLTQLERNAQQALVVRSRNGVRPTQAGDVMLRHGRVILQELGRMADNLDQMRGEVTGKLTVSTNVLFNQTLLVPIWAALKRDHPGLAIRTIPTDELVDVEADGIDIAVRTGQPGNGSGVVRRVAELDMLLACTPGYLQDRRAPNGPDGLAALDYIQYREDPDQTHLTLMIDGQPCPVPISVAFDAQNPNLVMHAISSGLGYARVPRCMAAEALRRGTLIELLPDTPPEPKPIFLVQARHSVDTPRNIVFRQQLFRQFEDEPDILLSSSARSEMNAPHGA